MANLKPAKFMGVESQGTVLASAYEGVLELVEIRDANSGDVIS